MHSQNISSGIQQQSTILSVENDSLWQEKITEATRDFQGMSVDFVETYKRAIEYIKSETPDVVTLDSRLPKRPRIHDLIRNTRSCLGDSVSIVALTSWPNDVSARDREQLFALLDKSKYLAGDLLGDEISAAFRASFLNQAHGLLCNSWNFKEANLPEDIGELVNLLNISGAAIGDERGASLLSISSKLVDYQRWVDPEANLSKPVVLLELCGYISEINGDDVEVALYNSDGGLEDRRIFSAERLKAADLCSQDDHFRYTIIRKGADVISHIERAEPSIDNSQLDRIRGFDISKFDDFQVSEEE